jgi:NAD(P)-dependent dehydrogenase (short-subunit alcohol dehydrogenase family)
MIIMHASHGLPTHPYKRMERNNRFRDQTIVVIGGSSGIGLAVAEQAVKEGARVVIASSNPDRVQKAADSIGKQAEGRSLDLGEETAVQQFFDGVGPFDHLVITAGDTLRLSELSATDLSEARNAFELRFWGALAAVKYGAPQIRRGGSVVLTTGIAGERPQKSWTIAASVCGAIISLTRALAVELAPIRVNAVSPGIVRTNLWGSMNENEREQLFEALGQKLPAARVGEPGDIARAYLYLMEEGYSTGQTITVDGGLVLV